MNDLAATFLGDDFTGLGPSRDKTSPHLSRPLPVRTDAKRLT
jgi:hypothetical protein